MHIVGKPKPSTSLEPKIRPPLEKKSRVKIFAKVGLFLDISNKFLKIILKMTQIPQGKSQMFKSKMKHQRFWKSKPREIVALTFREILILKKFFDQKCDTNDEVRAQVDLYKSMKPRPL